MGGARQTLELDYDSFSGLFITDCCFTGERDACAAWQITQGNLGRTFAKGGEADVKGTTAVL